MAIAFALLTFTNLEQIERLAATLAAGLPERITVVAHRGPAADVRRLARADGIDRVIPSPGGRATFGVLDGLISCLRWLERQPRCYDWLVLASGQDYPIRPLDEFAAYLAASRFDGHFHHFDVLDAEAAMAPPMRWTRRLAEDRYLFHYVRLKSHPTTSDRAVLKLPRIVSEWTHKYRLHTSFGIMIGKRCSVTPFSDEFRLYGGNFWITINRRAVGAILDFVDARPDVVHYFRGTIAPEEAFLQTVLANQRDLELSPVDVRYVEFSEQHGHTATLGVSDLDRVLASGCFMARKFDLRTAPEVFDILDARVLGRTKAGKRQVWPGVSDSARPADAGQGAAPPSPDGSAEQSAGQRVA